jgi:hypothetical protein
MAMTCSHNTGWDEFLLVRLPPVEDILELELTN